MIPTCDDTHAPTIKTVVHLAAACLYGVMLAYHAVAGFNHWRTRHSSLPER